MVYLSTTLHRWSHLKGLTYKSEQLVNKITKTNIDTNNKHNKYTFTLDTYTNINLKSNHQR